MTAPVPSPTPDEQAAEGQVVFLCGDTGAAGESQCMQPALPGDDFCYAHGKAWDEQHPEVELILSSELADLRAALVVVRERLAAVEALCDEAGTDLYSCHLHGVRLRPGCASCDHASALDDAVIDLVRRVRAALVGRPPTPHPTQEKP